MGCTIDHLRVDARVTVLQGFTDLSGQCVRAGERGVVRGLGLDYATWEIWIELERDGATSRLRFALRASDGPRNGHMREYFDVVAEEVGQCADGPSEVRSAPDVARVDAGASSSEVKAPAQPQPSHETSTKTSGANLGERRVACACDAALQRWLLPARSELSLWACMRCGALTCTRTIGDDGRFTGDAWQQHIEVGLPFDVVRWLAGWPRVAIDHTSHTRWPMSADLVRYATVFLPPEVRCENGEQLAEVEARLAREQAALTRAQLLRTTHRVRGPVPAGVPRELVGYAILAQALALNERSDLRDLLHHARLSNPGNELAAQILRARPDVFDVVEDCLRSSDGAQRGIGFAIARDWHPPDARLAGLLIELLGTLSFERSPHSPMCIVDRGRGELFLLLIAELRLATPHVLESLRALMRTLARHDDFLTDCTRRVVQELKAAAGTGS